MDFIMIYKKLVYNFISVDQTSLNSTSLYTTQSLQVIVSKTPQMPCVQNQTHHLPWKSSSSGPLFLSIILSYKPKN